MLSLSGSYVEITQHTFHLYIICLIKVNLLNISFILTIENTTQLDLLLNIWDESLEKAPWDPVIFYTMSAHWDYPFYQGHDK